MMKEVILSDYAYDLPQENIAQFPLEQRDQSKLLSYQKGVITHGVFSDLASKLNENSLLIFNDTRVIPARTWFQRATGAVIEVFLLDPVAPSEAIEEVMHERKTCVWRCMIGNLKKWSDQEEITLNTASNVVSAKLLNREERLVRFSWESGKSFAQVLHEMGKIPLPPYIKRDVNQSDEENYQTIYARKDGAVAAPTAGLHFTPFVFETLKSKQIETTSVTLHVGAGTFQPVNVENAWLHPMHSERFSVSLASLSQIVAYADRTAVGTTTLRTLESLYWMGIKLIRGKEHPEILTQEESYLLEAESTDLPAYEIALNAIIDDLRQHQLDEWQGQTAIYMMPGYTFRSIKRLITNFHLPSTTLILLVAAYIGEDWRKVYEEALNNEYRFLSFGDSSLLEP